MRSLTQENITVVMTPPFPSDRIIKKFKEKNLCSVIKRDNQTEKFQVRPNKRTSRFGEKIAVLSKMDYEEVLFLDNDTRILEDPQKLFNHDFEFSARIDNGFYLVNWDKWADVFEGMGKRSKPLFNAGVLAFKNYSCRRLMSQALFFLSLDLPRYGEYYQKDQLAISLSISFYDRVRCMDRTDHAFRWMDEPHDTVIYHGSKRPFIKRLGVYFKNLVNHYA